MTRVTRTEGALLLSVRPRHAENIMRGSKTVELRRRFSTDAQNASVLIYATSPVQAIVGSASIREVRRLDLPELWERFGAATRILRHEFEAYFAGLQHGYAILLANVTPFPHHLCVAELRRRFGFVPPQSFMYLRQEHYPLLDHERLQDPD